MTNLLKYFSKYGLLLLIPLIYWIVSFALHLNWGSFYQNTVDPEYTLIYNGVIVSSGSFAINFIHHPATPTIFIAGLSSLICRVFSAHSSFVQDFITEPEKYIHAAQLLQLSIIALFCFGFAKKLKDENVWKPSSWIVLLSLLSHQSLIEISARFLPETTLIIPLFTIMVLIIRYIEFGEQNHKQFLWQFPLWIGFAIACKIHFAPLILIPFVLLANSKKSFWLLSRNTFLAVLVFAYPLFTNLSASFTWFSNMASHTGKHGQGDSGIISTENFSQHLSLLIEHHPVFWILLILNVFLLVHLVTKTNLSAKILKLRKSLFSVCLVFSIILALVLKHFALHYFIPLYIWIGILIYFPSYYLSSQWKSIQKKVMIALTAFVVILILFNIQESRQVYEERQVLLKERNEIKTNIDQIVPQGAALIVNAPHWGTPFPAYAHSFGFMHTYKRKTYFKQALKQAYPHFYLQVGWMPEYNHWDEFISLEEILKKEKKVFFYNQLETAEPRKLQNQIEALKAKGINIVFQKLWQSDQKVELYQLSLIS